MASQVATVKTVDFKYYTISRYVDDVSKYGLETLWSSILEYTLENDSELLKVENFGYLYELGLAEQNKSSKKKYGQYFTPDDVADVMAQWLTEVKGGNVCDVCCGTGNLILAYLKQLEKNEAERLLTERKIYLYDNDGTALKIAMYSIAMIYGKQFLNSVNLIHGDFLDKRISLPGEAKVISNPPYAKILDIKSNWQMTNNLLSSKDFYSAIMEKIVTSGSQAVIITPYSFLGGSKFYSLREVMNDYSGFIVAFDNVPANIFNGKKHGIFNSNKANSVRAAITVVDNNQGSKGFRVSHLIRFKTDERAKLLSHGYLQDLVSRKSQIVSRDNPCFAKCHKELQNAFDIWNDKSNTTLRSLLSPIENEFALYIPNTCRYFTTASITKLNRTGMITLYAKNQASFDLLYCLINSSFAYWHWRIYDGGITYPIGLLNALPVFDNLLSSDDRKYFCETRNRMSAQESKFIIKKLNAGEYQENIKFPSAFRNEINARFFKILSITDNPKLLDMVHSNAVFPPELA